MIHSIGSVAFKEIVILNTNVDNILCFLDFWYTVRKST